MKTGVLTNGSMVKNLIPLKTEFRLSVTRRTSFLLWFQACQVLPLHLHRLQRQLRDRRVIPSSSSPTISEIQIRERKNGINSDTFPVQLSNSVGDRSRHLMKQTKPMKSKILKRRKPRQNGETPECMENLVDDEIPEDGDRGKAAQERVQRGQVSRARHELTSAKLPQDEATLNELRNRPQEQLREIPGDVLNFQPEAPPETVRNKFERSPLGFSPCPGGCCYEM